MPASDKHVLDYAGLQYFKGKIYSDLKTINGSAITGGGNINLVVANTAITGATKCKITYDSKGLVTGGADLAATDLPNNYGDGKNPYASKTANYVLAAPNGSAGAPSFRALVAADIPSLAISKITDLQTVLDGKYVKPQGGIPASDLAETYLLVSAKGASNGVASLDSNSKIPLSQIPEAILGASEQGGVISYSNNVLTVSLNQNGAALLGTTAGNKTWSELAALLYANQAEGTGLYFIFENDVDSYDFAINSVSNVITDIQVGDWVIYNGGTDIRKIENVDAVKSVQIIGTSPIVSSNATAQNGIVVATLSLANAYGDVKNPYGSKTANYVLAAPNGSAGEPSFRALLADDIPALPISKITDLQTSLNNKSLVRKVTPAIEEWISKTWNGLSSFNCNYLWTDGDNIYYSVTSTQYILDKTTSTWSVKTWNGYTSIVGSNIWTDGDNIYYSAGSTQYILDKTTSTWSVKTWNGLSSFYGIKVWTDGENIYYSDDSTQYVLDKTTSTWSVKTWNGLSSFNGNYIWTDGENIYYTDRPNNYILNKTTSTWSVKTWNGYSSMQNGSYIWTDGENIYYSYNSAQYVLDKTTSTWSVKTWNGLSSFDGSKIWIDSDNIYYSDSSNQYVLNKQEASFENVPVADFTVEGGTLILEWL